MKPEEIEALDLKLGQRIELTLNTSIGLNKQPLLDNETYTEMVYYQGLSRNEFNTCRLNYYKATGQTWNAKMPIKDSVLVALVNKINYVQVI